MDEELRQAARDLLIRWVGDTVQSPLTTIRGSILPGTDTADPSPGGWADRLAVMP